MKEVIFVRLEENSFGDWMHHCETETVEVDFGCDTAAEDLAQYWIQNDEMPDYEKVVDGRFIKIISNSGEMVSLYEAWYKPER